MTQIAYHTDVKELKNRGYLTQNEDFLNDARRFLFTRGGYDPRDLEDPDFVYDKYLELNKKEFNKNLKLMTK